MKTTKAKNTKTGAELERDHKLLALVRLEPPTTREALVELCQETTRLTIERDAMQLKLDRRVLDLQEAQLPLIEKMNGQIDRSVKLMQMWALANRETEFDGRQGIEVGGCTLEFRKGTGRVEAAVDEKTSVNQLLSLPASYEEEQQTLVRLKCDLNKQAVIAMAKTDVGAAFLAKLGLRIVVDEEFKFTPAREDLTPLPVAGSKFLKAAAVA